MRNIDLQKNEFQLATGVASILKKKSPLIVRVNGNTVKLVADYRGIKRNNIVQIEIEYQNACNKIISVLNKNGLVLQDVESKKKINRSHTLTLRDIYKTANLNNYTTIDWIGSIAERMGMIIENITVCGHLINTVKGGKGKPIVLLNGINMGWRQWVANLEYFKNNYYIIAFDFPGTGFSSDYKYTSSIINDSIAIVGEIVKKSTVKTTLIGHSFGGMIAIKSLILNPNKYNYAVVISTQGLTNRVPGSQKPITNTSFAKLLSKTALKPSKKTMKKFLSSAFNDKNLLDDHFVEYYTEVVSSSPDRHPLLFMSSISSRGKMLPETLISKNDLRKLADKILIIHGKKDPLFPIKHTRAALNDIINIDYRELDTGHVVPMEDPDGFGKIVGRYLNVK